MESSSSSSSFSTSASLKIPSSALSLWDYITLFFFRPFLAISFSLSLLIFGWFLAWKLVLVHVPLVQEIFGMRKKPVKPKPEGRRRLTQFYNSIGARRSAS